MPVNDKAKLRCYVILPFDKESQLLREVIKTTAKEVSVKLVLPDEKTSMQVPIAELVYSEITRCDLVIADISQYNPNIL